MIPNKPIFKALSALRGAKIAQHGLKMGSFHLFVHPNSPKESLFGPFLADVWSKQPFSRHFVTLEWQQWLARGSERAHFTCLCTPNGLGSFLDKHSFDPFLTHFWLHIF